MRATVLCLSMSYLLFVAFASGCAGGTSEYVIADPTCAGVFVIN